MTNLFLDPSSSVDLRDRLHVIIKNFREAFPDNFEKCGITPCESCGATGLPVNPAILEDTGGLTFWQPRTYCKHCNGIGFHGIERVYEKYLCTCDGEKHCKKCKDTGLVDWVTKAMGG